MNTELDLDRLYALKRRYYTLQAELDAIGEKVGSCCYFTDECVDRENADLPEDHPDFWVRMYFSACDAAGYRAAEMGLDINTLIGRVIF